MSQWVRRFMRLGVVACLATAGLPGYADALLISGNSNRWDQGDGGGVVRSKYERYGRDGEYIVQGHERADGSFDVRVIDMAAMVVFQSRFPVFESDGEPYVRWTYRDGQKMVEKSARPNPVEAPRLETMMFGAKDIVRMVVVAYERTGRSPDDPETTGRGRVGTQDAWGCDIPDWTGIDISCSSKGNCCDTHDSCYAAFNCSAVSWAQGVASGPCYLCNVAVTACMTIGLGDTSQPSACCALGNCGQERCTSGSWDDPNCSPSGGSGTEGCPRCVQNLDPGTGGPGYAGGWSWDGPSGGISYQGNFCCFPPDEHGNPGFCMPCSG